MFLVFVELVILFFERIKQTVNDECTFIFLEIAEQTVSDSVFKGHFNLLE